MIPRTVATWQYREWQEELADLITEPEALIEALDLDPGLLPAARLAGAEFKLKVPRPYFNRMVPGDPDDPLLKQVLPLGAELETAPDYLQDPVGDQAANTLPGLIHKYHGRVLLIISGNCAVNCRYCFRRHFPYEDNKPNRKQWLDAIDYIAADSSITEVIFSGGDPLSLGDRQLDWLCGELEKIPHLQRLRIHTRLPVVVPSRINEDCLTWLRRDRLHTVMVLHINHAQEIDDYLRESIAKLKAANITVLNQAVLLRDINDSLEAQIELSEALFRAGVLPYYLHLLDKVQGGQHFAVSREKAKILRSEMLKQLPGYLMPRFVEEIAGEPSKTAL